MGLFKDTDIKIYELKRAGVAQEEIEMYEGLEKINDEHVEKSAKLHELEEKTFYKIQKADKRIDDIEKKLEKMREKARTFSKIKI